MVDKHFILALIHMMLNIFGAQLKKTNLENIYQDIGVIAQRQKPVYVGLTKSSKGLAIIENVQKCQKGNPKLLLIFTPTSQNSS